MDNTAHTPVNEILIRRIKAAANNAADGRIRHNVSLTRLYKTDESWRHSQSFGPRRSAAGFYLRSKR